jgi:hypothetical protein
MNRCEDNFKMDLKYIGSEDGDRIQGIQDRAKG